MGVLSKLGITDGQPIEAEHILRIIKALIGESANDLIIDGDITASGAINEGPPVFPKRVYLECSAPSTVNIIYQTGFSTPVTASIAGDMLTITSPDGEFNSKFLRHTSTGRPNDVQDSNTIICELYDNFDDFSMEVKGS